MNGHFYCVRCKSTPLDDPSEWSDVCWKCLRTFYIVQVKTYSNSISDRPRKYSWEVMLKNDFSMFGDSFDIKRFKTSEQAERGIKRHIRKHCYNDYSSNRHRYRIVKCEVVT